MKVTSQASITGAFTNKNKELTFYTRLTRRIHHLLSEGDIIKTILLIVVRTLILAI